jgi:hypothetical protein
MAELTGYTVSEHTVAPTGDIGPNGEQTSDMDHGGLLLASRSVADKYFGETDESGAEDVRAFIADTEFGAGDRLLYLQSYAPQSCYALTIADDPTITEDGVPRVDASIDRTAPDDYACADVITTVRLLVRLSFASNTEPSDVVEIHIASSRGTSEPFRIRAER